VGYGPLAKAYVRWRGKGFTKVSRFHPPAEIPTSPYSMVVVHEIVLIASYAMQEEALHLTYLVKATVQKCPVK